VAVFDEAHSLEEIATSFLGETLSTNQLMELVNDLEKEAENSKDSDRNKLKKHLNAIRTGAERLRIFFNDREDKGRLDNGTLSMMLKGPVREIRQGLEYIYEESGFGKSDKAALHAMPQRARDIGDLLDQILKKRNSKWLNWYEKRKRSLILHASPLDISGRMNELLYEKVRSVVFTSATLSTNRNFDYIRSRLGLSRTLEGIYTSHFDFKTQTLMYIPKDLPSPNAPDFASNLAKRIMGILKRTQGRALVLFTSYRNLNVVHHILEDRAPYTVYRQGQAPRSLLLEEFRRDIHSVLLATGSFWQGVDVPGESLSCLIIDKLPFDSPGEPIVAARIDAIHDNGGNPFMEYQVPSAIISLKQGLGRLIRKNSDRGILSVLDTRIVTSRYGRFFLASLPEIPLTHKLSDISRFFE
jgi:ATP-dependent DNA helicase DinG